MTAKEILTVESARIVVGPLYDCLNEPSKKDVNALLEEGVNHDYKSYHTNDEFLTRDQLAEVFKQMGVTVPDLRWIVEDIQVPQEIKKKVVYLCFIRNDPYVYYRV